MLTSGLIKFWDSLPDFSWFALNGPESGNGSLSASEAEFQRLRRKAETGNRNAQFLLAQAFETGTGVSRDASKALEWYTQAAENGHSESQFIIARAFFSGSGVEQDYKTSVKYFELAAESGWPAAQGMLGILFSRGIGGVHKDRTLAIKWWTEGAANSHSPSQCALGLAYLHGTLGLRRDTKRALEYIHVAAEEPHAYAPAMYELGILYLDGLAGIAVNREEGILWLRKAAARGYHKAMEVLSNLGQPYEDVEGDAEEGESAEKDLTPEEENGKKEAILSGFLLALAKSFGDGRGVVKGSVDSESSCFGQRRIGNARRSVFRLNRSARVPGRHFLSSLLAIASISPLEESSLVGVRWRRPFTGISNFCMGNSVSSNGTLGASTRLWRSVEGSRILMRYTQSHLSRASNGSGVLRGGIRLAGLVVAKGRMQRFGRVRVVRAARGGVWGAFVFGAIMISSYRPHNDSVRPRNSDLL